jgi:hypothetical protein
MSGINLTVASYLPVWIWDWLEILFGASVLIGVIAQRSHSPRFQRSNIKCTGDKITTFGGQVGLAFIGVLAFITLLDGMDPRPSPPRTMVIFGLCGYCLVQIRVMYEIFGEMFRALSRGRRRANKMDR